MKNLIHECVTLEEAIKFRRKELSEEPLTKRKEDGIKFLNSLGKLLHRPKHVVFKGEIKESFIILTKSFVSHEGSYPELLNTAILLNQHILSNQIENMNNQFEPRKHNYK